MLISFVLWSHASTLTEMSSLSEDLLDLKAYTALKEDAITDAKAAFREMTRRDEADAFAHVWLGHLAIRTGDLADAEIEFSKAVAKVTSRMESVDAAEGYAKRAKKAQLEQNLRHVRNRIIAGSQPSCSTEAAPPLELEAIVRIHRSELSHSHFTTEFARARRPVIIQGFEDGLGPANWTIDRLRDVCGDAAAPIRRHTKTTASWAELQEIGSRDFGEYLDELEAGDAGSEFVFDWPLRARTGCPALLADLGVPSYFTGGTIAAFGPALFAQGSGTKCGLHVDSHGTAHLHHFRSRRDLA